jgi:hypothetical protein
VICRNSPKDNIGTAIKALTDAASNGGFPMTKLLSGFGASMQMLLALAAFCMFWGFVAFFIYGVVQWLGFGDKAAYWSAFISTGMVAVLFYLQRWHMIAISQHRLTTWALTVLAWVFIAAVVSAVVLAIGFVVLVLMLNPPELSTHELMVIGLVLLAGILWQLTKIANKR